MSRPRRSISFVDPRSFLRQGMWDDFMNDGFGALSVSSYGIDMYETENQIVVEVEAPKFKSEDVDISIEDNTLTVSGHYKKKEAEEDESKRYHYKEIVQQSFSRSVTLPVRVKADEAEAEFVDGLIKVTLPKAEEVKPKKISIKTKSD